VVWQQHPVGGRQASSPIAAAAPAGSHPGASNQSDADETIPEVGSSQMEVVQDLDFYRWLAAQPTMASAAPAGRGR
jgi:hypothetical protein